MQMIRMMASNPKILLSWHVCQCKATLKAEAAKLPLSVFFIHTLRALNLTFEGLETDICLHVEQFFLTIITAAARHSLSIHASRSFV